MPRLVLGEDTGGRRHFLDGKPVNAGTALEVQLVDGKWLAVRYEGQWRKDTIRPRFFLGLGPCEVTSEGEVTNRRRDVEFVLPDNAELRWPSGKRGQWGVPEPHPDTVGLWPSKSDVERRRSAAP